MSSSGYYGYSRLGTEPSGGYVTTGSSNMGIIFTDAFKVSPFMPKKKVFEECELTKVGIAVPGVLGKDLSVWVEKNEVVVSYTKRDEINMEEDYNLMEGNFTVTIPLEFYHSVKKITSKLERGILWIYIPHKPEYDNYIEISE